MSIWKSSRNSQGDLLDSNGFVSEIEKKLVPIAPIVEFAIKKQMGEVGASREHMTPEQAITFIGKMADALELFMGHKGAQESHKFMMSTLRKYAPEYFEEHSLI